MHQAVWFPCTVSNRAVGNDHFCDTTQRVSQRLPPFEQGIPLYHRSGWINPLIPQLWSPKRQLTQPIDFEGPSHRRRPKGEETSFRSARLGFRFRFPRHTGPGPRFGRCRGKSVGRTRGGGHGAKTAQKLPQDRSFSKWPLVFGIKRQTTRKPLPFCGRLV